jgi:hypothetical protein
VHALDRTLPRTKEPIAFILNPPAWSVTWFQVALRASQGVIGPPVYALYAGTQTVDVQRVDARSLELHVARGWCATQFNCLRDLSRVPFRAGDRIELAHVAIEVHAVNAEGAPTRALFTFERSLDDPGLSFRSWQGEKAVPWSPPPVGQQVQLGAGRAL